MLRRVSEVIGQSSDQTPRLADLRERLKLLHRMAGEPSARTIAHRLGPGTLSHTTVNTLLRCERVPRRWEQLELIVEELGGDTKEFHAHWMAAKYEKDFLNGDAGAPDAVEPGDVAYEVVIVSCDIVGHSSEASHQVQRRRVREINAIVATSIEDHGPHRVIWLSGGDGGHVVFRDLAAGGAWWRAAVIDLIRRLRAWSAAEGRRLRVTGHAGEATHLPGADGRTQIVGDGINVAGWLLDRGGPDGVVVSEAFRRRLEHHGPLDAVNFHEPRVLRDKKLVDQELMLMSFGDSASQWYRPVNEDRAQLRRALERLDAPAAGPRRQGWEVLLWAKRVLQFNKNDQEARQALGRLVREDLQCRTDDGRDGLNPFFADLDPTLLREVVESAELVHRGYNEVLCRTGDEGDTMFVILRGRVGVYKKPGDESQVEPDYSHEEGEVVGELAFALAGNRTADLVALTETLLLAFNYNQLLKLLPPGRVGHEVRARVARFINHRALQHVSERVTFLVGPDGTGPLTRGTEPVQQTLAGLSWYCELIAMDRNQPITFEAAGGTEGIYLLAAGAVLDDRDGVLSAADFPVLWAALPGLPREQTASFTANSNEIKVLQIDAAGLERLDLEKLHALRASLTSR